MISAILFDLDDCLVFSEPIHLEASRRIFEPLGCDINTIPDNLVKTFFGMRVKEIIKAMAIFFKIEDKVDIQELHDKREEIFLELVNAELKPMPGLFKLINTVKEMDVKKAVASSGTTPYIKAIVKKFGMEDFFDVIVGGDMVLKAKPDPAIFLKAAELLSIPPKNCLVIEDSENGLEAAKTAGMFCICARYPNPRYKQDLSKADIVVNSLDKITKEMLKGEI